MRYAIVIEWADGNFSTHVPGLPGCVSTGQSIEETRRNIREAIEFHFDGLREDGITAPEPTTYVEVVDVPQAA